MSRSQAYSSSPIKSSPVSPEKEHVGIKCSCGHEAIRLVSKTPKNPGRPFYKCASDGCKLFKWEDEISGPSHQIGARTPSSSQSQPSQMMMQTPVRTSSSSSLPGSTPWTNQTPSRPPMSTNPNKRKRSPSPSPTASPSTPTMRRRDGIIQSTSRSFGPSETDTTNAFSMSVANPVASTSAGGGSGGASPAKRAKVDNASAAGSLFSDDDDDFWRDAVINASALPLEGERRSDDHEVSSAQPLKKSVSFQELNGIGDENIGDEDGILVDTSILRRLDFKNKRGPSPDRLINIHVRDGTEDGPIVDNDPSNPFRTHEPLPTTPIRPSTSYTNGTATRTPSMHPASSPLVGTSTGLLSLNTSPSSVDPMPTFSRFEEFLPDLASAFPDLRQKITNLERRKAADAKSIEAKLKRIRALEEEVRKLEELREENSRLRMENARLRGA